MPAYRFYLGDVITGELLDELPMTSASYSHVLNEPGECQVTVKLTQPPRKAAVLRQAHRPGRSTIVVARDGVLVWGGLLWRSTPDFDADTVTLTAAGWHSYFRRRVIDDDLDFEQVDQATIAADLIDHAQGSFWDAVRVDTSMVEPTGVLRDRHYVGDEYKPIAEAVEQLSQVLDGFDFRFETARDSDGIFTRFLVDYPATGRPMGLVLVLGNQLSSLSVDEDASTLATVAYGVGRDALRAVWHTPSLRGVYPRLDAVVSHTDVTRTSTLDDHVRRRLRRGREPVRIPNLTLDPDLQPPLGSYRVGDLVDVRAAKGWYDLRETYRFTAITVGVTPTGDETVNVDVAQEAVML